MLGSAKKAAAMFSSMNGSVVCNSTVIPKIKIGLLSVLTCILFAVSGALATEYSTISLGKTYDGSITATNTSNRYQVVLPQAGKLLLNITTSTDVERLYDQVANVQWLNNDYSQRKTSIGGISLPHNDSMEVPAGTYYVEIVQISGINGNTGKYGLRVDCIVNPIEPNNTIIAAQSLPMGYTVRGNITSSNSVDMYKYVLTESGRLTINANLGSSSSGLYDAYVKWYNANGTQIKSDNIYSSSVYMDLDAGTYYIGITPYGSRTGAYNLRGDFTAAGNYEVEPNNTIATAQSLTSGQTVKGFISYQDNSDIYKYVLAESGRLTVNVNLGSNNSIWLYDAYVKWYNADGTQIKSDNIYSSSVYMDLDAGTYYIGITPYGSRTGAYSLCGDFIAAGNNEVEPNETRPNAQLLTSGQTVKGFISYQDNTDMYRYVLTQSSRLTINVNLGSNNSVWLYDAYVKWYNADGTQIKSDNIYSSSVYKDLEAGTYYIGITPYGSRTGTYILTAYTGTAPTTSVTGVTIYPQTITMQKGLSQTLTATVTGTNLPAQTVTWSVTGNYNSGTTISTSGQLTIAATETATSLTVKAISTANTSISGTRIVCVGSPCNNPFPPQTPNITSHPAGATYTQNATATALSVTASVTDGGTLSYQWYRNTTNSTSGGTAVGTNSSSYTPVTISTGTYYYYVVVKNTKNSTTATNTSNTAAVTVNSAPVVNVCTPTISTQPTGGTVTAGGSHTLSVSASSGSGGGTTSAKNITVLMRDSYGDGWNGAKLRISVNGTNLSTNPTISSGSSNTYTFDTYVGDEVKVYWNNVGEYPGECAFAVYYTDAPPSSTFDPASGGTNNTDALLVYKQYSALSSTAAGTLLGTFTVGGSSCTAGTLSYQWYSTTSTTATGGTSISNATSSSYSVPTSTAGTYRYYVVVKSTITNNGDGGTKTSTVTSSVATVTVNSATATPTISSQPAGATYTQNATATALSVTASVTDNGTLSYQWYRNTTNSTSGGTAVGTNSSSYTPITTSTGTYYYYVVVTNTKNSIPATTTSSTAAVTVNAAPVVNVCTPTISTQPTGETVTAGGSHTLSVSASSGSAGGTTSAKNITVLMRDSYGDGWNGATLRISVNGTNLSTNPTMSSGNSNTYTFDTYVGDEVKVYWNNVGNYPTECAFAIYYTDAPPSSTFDPAFGGTNNTDALLVYKQYSALSSTAAGTLLGTFTVSGSSCTAGTLSYQWYSTTSTTATGGTSIGNATSSFYSVPTSTAGTYRYYVVVKSTITNNGDGGTKTSTVTSSVATVTVNAIVNAVTPIIISQPTGGSVTVGGTHTLSVSASTSDNGTLSYQWYSNISESNSGGTIIYGATNSSYSVSTSTAGTYYYYVVVTNTIVDNGDGGRKDTSVTSRVVKVTVNSLVNAAIPTITAQPQSVTISVGESFTASITATSSDGGTLSYAWYDGDGIVGTGSSYRVPTSEEGTYYYYAVVTNTIIDNGDGGQKTANIESELITVTVKSKDAVQSSDRTIPNANPSNGISSISPVPPLTSDFTVGPNPAVKSSGTVSIFRNGSRVAYATLFIYDASGNIVKKIRIIDDAVGSQTRRKVSTWNLRDGNGRPVAEGSYLVKGVIKTKDGKREKVSLVVGVR